MIPKDFKHLPEKHPLRKRFGCNYVPMSQLGIWAVDSSVSLDAYWCTEIVGPVSAVRVSGNAVHAGCSARFAFPVWGPRVISLSWTFGRISVLVGILTIQSGDNMYCRPAKNATRIITSPHSSSTIRFVMLVHQASSHQQGDGYGDLYHHIISPTEKKDQSSDGSESFYKRKDSQARHLEW